MSCSEMDDYAYAMAYDPWQYWQQMYPLDRKPAGEAVTPDFNKTQSPGTWGNENQQNAEG